MIRTSPTYTKCFDSTQLKAATAAAHSASPNEIPLFVAI